ncbi:MAG: hypothetical protein ACKO91_15320 [Acidimicrobiales bacterium]
MNRLLVFVLATLTALLGLHPGTTTASAATYTYDAPALARVDARATAPLGNGQWARVRVRERSVLPPVQVRGASTTFLSRNNATEAGTSRTFGIADRVAGQLDDVRLGSLRGQLGPDDLQRLVNAPGAQRYFDTATGNINVIQQVDDVLLRITTASDEFKIISVGPIRPNQVTNGVTNGRFVPIGGAG